MRLRPAWITLALFVGLAAEASAQTKSAPLPVKDEKAGKWGFVDARGTMVIAPAFTRVRRFREGLAAVSRDQTWEYIDVGGKTVIPGPYADARPFSQERAAVVAGEDGRWGYIDPTGKLVIPAKFFAADDFHDGRAVVRPEAKGQVGAIDARGELVAPARFAMLSSYAGGVAAFSDGKRWGYVDRDGRAVIPARFVRAEPFSEDLAFVVLKESRDKLEAAYIDRKGALVIKGLTRSGGPFRGGVARLYDLQSGTLIDRTGATILDHPGWVGDFAEGLAGVSVDGKVGYLDRKGKIVIPPQWDSAGTFENGVAIVSDLKDNAMVNHRYIDRTGKVIATVAQTDAPPP